MVRASLCYNCLRFLRDDCWGRNREAKSGGYPLVALELGLMVRVLLSHANSANRGGVGGDDEDPLGALLARSRVPRAPSAVWRAGAPPRSPTPAYESSSPLFMPIEDVAGEEGEGGSEEMDLEESGGEDGDEDGEGEEDEIVSSANDRGGRSRRERNITSLHLITSPYHSFHHHTLSSSSFDPLMNFIQLVVTQRLHSWLLAGSTYVQPTEVSTSAAKGSCTPSTQWVRTNRSPICPHSCIRTSK